MEFSERRDHWAALAIAAVQPFLLTWLLMALASFGIYAATASAPALSDCTWSDALHVASSFWLLAFGATVCAGDLRIGLVPLAIPLFALWLVYRAARRAGVVEWGDVAVVAATGALSACVVAFLALPDTFWLSAVLGAGIVGAVAALLAWRSWLIPSLAWWDRVERGWRYAWPLLALLAFAGLLLVFAALSAGRGRVDALYDAYATSRSGTFGLTLVQLLFLPDLAVWALSIAAGAPVRVGAGTSFSAFGTTAGTLPGLPFFGALPEPGARLPALVAIPVLAGLAAGFIAMRRAAHGNEAAEPSRHCGPGTLACDFGVAFGLVFAALALAGALSSGPLGSGPMTDVGPNAPLMALLLSLETGLGLAIVPGVRWAKEKRGKVDWSFHAARQRRSVSGGPERGPVAESRVTGLRHPGAVPPDSARKPVREPSRAATALAAPVPVSVSGTPAAAPEAHAGELPRAWLSRIRDNS